MAGTKKSAGSTILEVVVGFAAFILISAVFFHFVITVNQITERIICRNQELQELNTAYYTGKILEKSREGEETGICFVLVEEPDDEGMAEGAVSGGNGFIFSDSSLFCCTKSGGSEVLYVLEREKKKPRRTAPIASRSQAE